MDGDLGPDGSGAGGGRVAQRMPAEPFLVLDRLEKRFGELAVIRDLSLAVAEGEEERERARARRKLHAAAQTPR